MNGGQGYGPQRELDNFRVLFFFLLCFEAAR